MPPRRIHVPNDMSHSLLGPSPTWSSQKNYNAAHQGPSLLCRNTLVGSPPQPFSPSNMTCMAVVSTMIQWRLVKPEGPLLSPSIPSSPLPLPEGRQPVHPLYPWHCLKHRAYFDRLACRVDLQLVSRQISGMIDCWSIVDLAPVSPRSRPVVARSRRPCRSGARRSTHLTHARGTPHA